MSELKGYGSQGWRQLVARSAAVVRPFAFDPLGQETDTLVDRLTDKGSKSNFGSNSIYSKENLESVIGFLFFFSFFPFFFSFFFLFLLFSVFNKQQSQDAVMSNGSRSQTAVKSDIFYVKQISLSLK